MKKSLKKAKGKAEKKENNLEKLNKEEVKDVTGGTKQPKAHGPR